MDNQQTKSTEQPEGASAKPDVLQEVAGGYLLASTMVAFLSLYFVGLVNLVGVSL